ncbi:MAG: hypothetical protein AAGC43_17650 [Bacteroidota bacterium]
MRKTAPDSLPPHQTFTKNLMIPLLLIERWCWHWMSSAAVEITNLPRSKKKNNKLFLLNFLHGGSTLTTLSGVDNQETFKNPSRDFDVMLPHGNFIFVLGGLIGLSLIHRGEKRLFFSEDLLDSYPSRKILCSIIVILRIF